ncbi:hypothetical protein FACS189494_03490 [Spirochaetia bacterium]|nr:hypothetical protein FACS189494_03490 [Spirochaetia bacterium]
MKSYFLAKSDQINALATEVWNNLGSGFTMDVYTDAMEMEFAENGKFRLASTAMAPLPWRLNRYEQVQPAAAAVR